MTGSETDEVWLPVVGFEGFFEVSSEGRVRSLDRIVTRRDTGSTYAMRGRVLSTFPRSGYRYVHLKVAGVVFTTGVHQIACRAFHGAGDEDWEVRHKDGSRDRNAESNLEWGTVSQNKMDMVDHGRHHNAEKTHCKNQHEFTPENTRVRIKKNGLTARECRRCIRHRQRQNRAAA